MDSSRICALLHPFLPAESLTTQQLSALSTYLDLLLRWNARMNLTAVRQPEAIVTRHFGESLFAARHLFPPGSSLPAPDAQLADLGSGAGFPGVPIKIYAPQLRLTLVESKYRKTIFLGELLRTLQLQHAEVFSGRIEDFAPSAAASLTLTLRAVERFDDVLPVAARLLQRFHDHPTTQSPNRPMSRLALLIGASQLERARRLAPQLTWSEPLPVPQSSARVLLVGSLK